MSPVKPIRHSVQVRSLDRPNQKMDEVITKFVQTPNDSLVKSTKYGFNPTGHFRPSVFEPLPVHKYPPETSKNSERKKRPTLEPEEDMFALETATQGVSTVSEKITPPISSGPQCVVNIGQPALGDKHR